MEVWIWVLIYGGLLALSLALFIGRTQATMGWVLGIAGVVLAAVGAGLVVVRSRMPPDES
jgi:hypothetical protein